jgi:predicted Zn-dependent protease
LQSIERTQFLQERLPNNGLWSKRTGENLMTFTRMIPSLVCVAVLSACATGGQGSGSSSKTVAAAMSEADAAVMAGQSDKAYAILKNASSAFPTDKTPWQRMAQMRFDAGNYGEAIVNAQEALERDPSDTLSNSIAAVAGLRVSTKALADLSEKNNLSGTVRTEAEDLAKLLRGALGTDTLVSPGSTRTIAKNSAKKPAPRAEPKEPAAAPSRPSPAASSDPFGALK